MAVTSPGEKSPGGGAARRDGDEAMAMAMAMIAVEGDDDNGEGGDDDDDDDILYGDGGERRDVPPLYLPRGGPGCRAHKHPPPSLLSMVGGGHSDCA